MGSDSSAGHSVNAAVARSVGRCGSYGAETAEDSGWVTRGLLWTRSHRQGDKGGRRLERGQEQAGRYAHRQRAATAARRGEQADHAPLPPPHPPGGEQGQPAENAAQGGGGVRELVLIARLTPPLGSGGALA